MSFFDQGIKFLSFFIFIFFSIFFYFAYNWTVPHGFGEKRNARAAFIFTLLQTFQIFLIGVIIVGFFSFIFKYFSDLIKLIFPI